MLLPRIWFAFSFNPAIAVRGIRPRGQKPDLISRCEVTEILRKLLLAFRIDKSQGVDELRLAAEAYKNLTLHLAGRDL